jgi:two-component system CheB/CheR fusion protein
MPDTDEAGLTPGHPSERTAAPAGSPLIVAIGASAGGLTAFQSFFAAMPLDSGMSFVLVQHLDPHYQSMLVDILARDVTMPVRMAVEGDMVEPNTIHVIPPNATLTIRDGILHVERPAPARVHRWPINTFFAALAEDQSENAVGIVLAGIGSDGANGVAAIKAHGGLTIAQSEYDHIAMSGMPEQATATGHVDYVLRLEEMPARLLQYQRHLAAVAGHKGGDGIRMDAQEALPVIMGLLQARLGHDFSQYKTSTVIRRIQRRMQVLEIDTMNDFVDRLRHDQGQIDLLFSELLIGVTQFMRDTDAFEALAATALPKIMEGITDAGEIRVWVPGCSTGEEVYSIAILLKEACEAAGVAPKLQIFGTDIDERAVAAARTGQYVTAMKGVPPEMIARWFVRDVDCYRVAREIREICIFSMHSLIKDPPFSRINLISCRNLLIYMNPSLQEQVIRIFHYALRPGGVLFLGPFEGITRNPGLFRNLDRKHRLFQRRDGEAPRLAEVTEYRLPLAGGRALPRHPGTVTDDRIDKNARALLERHSPVYFVINDQNEIIRFSGGETARYMEPSPGPANFALFANLRKMLRPVVRSAVQSAFASGKPVVQQNVLLDIDGHLHNVVVIVEPMRDYGAGNELCVVAFRDLQRVRRRGPKGEAKAGEAAVLALEAELLATKARLQVAEEAAETAGEETRSSVEEYQSVNEELQSSNEELETAKEEMQSINEELQTINSELSVKNDQLTRLNSDVQNLLERTQIATVFVDSAVRIKGYTPAMRELFHLRPGDYGRPLREIASCLDYPELWDDIRQVLRDRVPVEREVQVLDAPRTFVTRIMAYGAQGDAADGAVLTFFEITTQKTTEQALREQAAIIEYANDAILGIAFDGTIRSWNPAATQLFGYEAAEMAGQPVDTLCPEELLPEQEQLMRTARAGQIAGPVETRRRCRDGEPVEIELTVVPIPDESGRPVAFASTVRDISERKRAERHRELLLHELSHRVKNALATVQSMAVQSLRGATSFDAFRDTFLSRLISLAQTHDLLTRQEWQGASLRDVLEAELQPYRRNAHQPWTLSGPAVQLDPKAALALGMAFHELITNAVKFGALSVSQGEIEIIWRTDEIEHGRCLHLTWTERGGPRVEPPSRKGFGSRLISDGLAYELNGRVEIVYEPEGLRCTVEVPIVEGKDKP